MAQGRAANIEALKNRNGCGFRISPAPRQITSGLKFYSCFCDHLDDSFDYLLFLQGQFEKGIMPYPGSLIEQPNKIIEVFKLISRLKAEYESKQQAKINKSNGR